MMEYYLKKVINLSYIYIAHIHGYMILRLHDSLIQDIYYIATKLILITG